jgi:hypothetical protein
LQATRCRSAISPGLRLLYALDEDDITLVDDMSRKSILDVVGDSVTLSGPIFRSNAAGRSVRFNDKGEAGSRKSDALRMKKLILSYIMVTWIESYSQLTSCL